MKTAVCRHCRQKYDPNKSRAFWEGYCSRKCEDAKAVSLGWKKNPGGNGLYDVLKKYKEIGRISTL